jgi:hypothetical protein
VVVEGLQSLPGAELAPLRAACGVRFGTRLVSALWRSERAAPPRPSTRPRCCQWGLERDPNPNPNRLLFVGLAG